MRVNPSPYNFCKTPHIVVAKLWWSSSILTMTGTTLTVSDGHISEANIGVDYNGMYLHFISTRETNYDYDTTRNRYDVALTGLSIGDTIVIKSSNEYPPPMTEIGVITHNGTVYKPWQYYGKTTTTIKTETNDPIWITLNSGDKSCNLYFYIYEKIVNGAQIDLSTITLK